MKGLLAILGKPKDDDDSEEKSPASAPAEKDTKNAYIDEAVSAARDGDWDGFGEALKACFGKG
jgi:hypothetical protein